MSKLLLAGIVSIVLFSGCSSSTQNNKIVKSTPSEPQWLDDPYYNGDKIAAIGCAKYHFKGESAQKKLAIQRARDEIAAQKNTTVSDVTLRNKKVNDGSYASSSMQSTSVHEVDQVNISTKVKATYKKPNGELCVWVVGQ
jgi:hypothetical protein